MRDQQSTLVMGARSGIGRLVLHHLVTRGLPVRASSRSVPESSRVDGVPLISADLRDPASLARAFDGIDQVFLFAVADGADVVREAARNAGVQRLVLLSSGSVLVPTSADNPITVEHRHVEQVLSVSGGPALIPIRPLVLATNTLRWAYEIKASGSVSLYQPDALSAPVHEADVAAAAVTALTQPLGGDHEDDHGDAAASGLLTGPAQLSQRDQVEVIGRAIGRDLAVIELGRDETLARLSRFVPAAEAAAILMFYDDCAAGHSPATETARQVLGRDPMSFSTWASDHTDDFR